MCFIEVADYVGVYLYGVYHLYVYTGSHRMNALGNFVKVSKVWLNSFAVLWVCQKVLFDISEIKSVGMAAMVSTTY